LLLNQSNRILGIYEVSSGGISGTVVDIRLLSSAALKAAAVGIIITHNHPSGKTAPSEADKNITRKNREAGKLLYYSAQPPDRNTRYLLLFCR
jgi:DNA repair protein RadC